MDFSNYFSPADEKHVKREKQKAKDLRKSQWWKNRLGESKCHYCEERFHPKELTMDHVTPIIRGGSTNKNNCVPCCKECNSQKKYLLPIEWSEYLQKLKKDASDKLS